MTARAQLLVSATVLGWAALALSAGTSGSSPLVGVLAGLGSLGVWHRRGHVAGLAVPLGCVALLASGTSVVVAGVAGVLVLAHVVLVDLVSDVHEASGRQVMSALRPLLPGALLATGATAGVAVAALLGQGASATMVAPLLLAAPLLLLSALLLALGHDTRRAFCSRLVPKRHLSAVTKRYLDRARGTS